MIEFIQRYWLEVLFGGIVAILTAFVKHLSNILKKEREDRKKKSEEESKEQELLKIAVLSLLHDRIYQVCQYHIQNGYVTVQDLNNLEYLYKGYSGLGGNGTGEALYNRCKALPIVSNDYSPTYPSNTSSEETV